MIDQKVIIEALQRWFVSDYDNTLHIIISKMSMSEHAIFNAVYADNVSLVPLAVNVATRLHTLGFELSSADPKDNCNFSHGGSSAFR